jgi:hypothetical protein
MHKLLVQSASGLLLLNWLICAILRACIGMGPQGLRHCVQLQHQHHSVPLVTVISTEQAAELCASNEPATVMMH